MSWGFGITNRLRILFTSIDCLTLALFFGISCTLFSQADARHLQTLPVERPAETTALPWPIAVVCMQSSRRYRHFLRTKRSFEALIRLCDPWCTIQHKSLSERNNYRKKSSPQTTTTTWVKVAGETEFDWIDWTWEGEDLLAVHIFFCFHVVY